MQFVRNEDQRMPVLRHLAEGLEEIIHFLGSQYGGRLIQDQQGRAAVEGFDDLNPLLLANGKLPDTGARVNLQSVLFAQHNDALFNLLEVEDKPAGRFQAQGHIFGDGQGWHQHEMLVNHADTGLDGIFR